MTETCPSCGYNLVNDKVIELGNWSLDPRGQVRYRSRILPLCQSHAQILHTLAKEHGRIVSPEVLYERCIDGEAENSVYAIIARLRARLRELSIPSPIRSGRGRGNRGYWWEI